MAPLPLRQPTPPPPPAAPADEATIWDEFATLLDEADHLAATHPISEQAGFDRRLLAMAIETLAADGAAMWRVPPTGGERRAVHAGVSASLTNENLRRRRETLLAAALLHRGEARRPLEPLRGAAAEDAVLHEAIAVAAPPASAGRPEDPHPPVLELLLAPGRDAAYYDAAARLLGALAASAEAYETRRRRHRLEVMATHNAALLRLASRVAGDLRPEPTAMRIAGAARDLLGVDRVSVVQSSPRGPRVLAISGLDAVDRKAPAPAALEHLVAATGEAPLAWPPGDEAAEVSDEAQAAADACVDVTHARTLRVAPVRLPEPPEPEDDAAPLPVGAPTAGWLVAETFTNLAPTRDDSAEPGVGLPERVPLESVAEAVAPALHAATHASAGSLTRLLGTNHRRWWTLPAALLAAVVGAAALAAIPVTHTVTLRGTLGPVQQRGVYAPCDARVAQTLVASGDRVVAGTPLVRLTDPESLIRLQEAEGSLATLTRSRDAAAALRLSADRRVADPAAALRLAAEAERLGAEVAAATAERNLILAEREALLVTSPIDGVVVTWRAEETLAGRPVRRGQRLLAVADDRGPWRLELDAPDDRAGLIAAARDAADQPLAITYEAFGYEGAAGTARLSQIAPQATPRADAFGAVTRRVRLEATPDDPLRPVADATPLPGSTVRARVDCGRRPLGYVALHDAWRAVADWWRL